MARFHVECLCPSSYSALADRASENALRSFSQSRDTRRVNRTEFRCSARFALPRTCLNHPQEFLAACGVFAMVVIKIETEEYFALSPPPTPLIHSHICCCCRQWLHCRTLPGNPQRHCHCSFRKHHHFLS